MKIVITSFEGDVLDTMHIPLEFDADEPAAAVDIHNMIGEIWSIREGDNKLMTPKQYEEYRKVQRLQGRTLRGPYAEELA